MMNKIVYVILIFTLFSCIDSVKKIENKKFGRHKAAYQLVISSEKKFIIDDNLATRPPYIQILSDPSSGTKLLTVLNKKNSIYFFNYTTSNYLKKISYQKEGPDGILQIIGYYIKNMDSIYVFNRPLIEIALTDTAGHVSNRISLKGTMSDWPLYYPQYDLKTVCPFFENSGKLILTGLHPFYIKDSLVNKFHFTACIDFKSNQVEYHHTYPYELYGNNVNWDDPIFMQVYSALLPSGKIVHSFPVSHDLYISEWNSDAAKKVYGGSNVAKTICSVDWDTKAGATPNELLRMHYLQQDSYTAILYDPWRHVYYRFMLQKINNATRQTTLNEKNIIVIMMDEQFNYLGETCIGKEDKWNWNNSFVTEEGLNIEFIDTEDTDEKFLNFKIFIIEKV